MLWPTRIAEVNVPFLNHVCHRKSCCLITYTLIWHSIPTKILKTQYPLSSISILEFKNYEVTHYDLKQKNPANQQNLVSIFKNLYFSLQASSIKSILYSFIKVQLFLLDICYATVVNQLFCLNCKTEQFRWWSRIPRYETSPSVQKNCH